MQLMSTGGTESVKAQVVDKGEYIKEFLVVKLC
jgi:hypothetical protein